MLTAGTWSTSTFILPYPQQFTVLPSAVRTPADFRFQKRHTALLTNVCEHPESINAVHSCPSTRTFMEGRFLVFNWSGVSLALRCYISKATASVATYLTTNLAHPTVQSLLAILQAVLRHVVGTTTPVASRFSIVTAHLWFWRRSSGGGGGQFCRAFVVSHDSSRSDQ